MSRSYQEFKHHVYVNNLGTCGTAERVNVLDDMDSAFCDAADNTTLMHDIGFCLDAPEMLPSGSTIKGRHQYVNARTQPGVVSRN